MIYFFDNHKKRKNMAIIFNQAAYDRAKYLIEKGEIETFDADWNEEKPTIDEIIHYLDAHYLGEYGLWFLGIDKDEPEDVKERYVYPYGDLKTVQRCALVHTIKEAEKNGHKEIVDAAKKLLEMVDSQD
jgi:hypothetical protein